MDAPINVEEVTQVTEPVEIFRADPTKHAFVTWCIIGDAYVPGAIVLARSIKNSGSTASRVCMISSDVSQEARNLLKTVFDEIVEVEVIDVKVPQKRKGDKRYDGLLPFFSKAFTKLHALNLVQYEKVCVIDADQLCVSDPDAIFEVEGPAGICSSFTRVTDEKKHGMPIDVKVIENIYKDNGIRGCTYLFKPSTADFERAIKQLAVKTKIVQYKIAKEDTMSVFTNAKKSAFALLDDSDEDEEEEEEKPVDNKSTIKTTRVLTAEEIAQSKFEVEPEVVYPFAVYKSEHAPVGFAYGENKKSMMGFDEMFICDFYKNQWKHIDQKYGYISYWKESNPVFLHYFNACPWSRDQDWKDYESWDEVALALMGDSEEMKKFFINSLSLLGKKFELGSPAAIDPPVVQVKKGKKGAKKEKVVTPVVETTEAVDVVPVDEEAAKPVYVPVAAPVKSAWGVKK